MPGDAAYDTSSRSQTRCSRDVEIREYGFKIHSRPASGEPVWERNGRLLPESAVINLVREERIKRRVKEEAERANAERTGTPEPKATKGDKYK